MRAAAGHVQSGKCTAIETTCSHQEAFGDRVAEFPEILKFRLCGPGKSVRVCESEKIQILLESPEKSQSDGTNGAARVQACPSYATNLPPQDGLLHLFWIDASTSMLKSPGSRFLIR